MMRHSLLLNRQVPFSFFHKWPENFPQVSLFNKSTQLTPPKTNMTAGKTSISRCISYWTWGFSIVMLVFRDNSIRFIWCLTLRPWRFQHVIIIPKDLGMSSKRWFSLYYIPILGMRLRPSILLDREGSGFLGYTLHFTSWKLTYALPSCTPLSCRISSHFPWRWDIMLLPRTKTRRDTQNFDGFQKVMPLKFKVWPFFWYEFVRFLGV